MPSSRKLEEIERLENISQHGPTHYRDHHQMLDLSYIIVVLPLKPPPSWYGLPGEIRNCIYWLCLSHEGDRVHSVRHYPHGFRRCRSKQQSGIFSNFPNSSWGFTQVNRQIRAEFKPWLLKQRRVKTPLATLNAYVEVFHPVHMDTGTRTGWIEPTKPKLSRVPIPVGGIEVFDLLKHNHSDSDFHLELRAEYPVISVYRRDELDILYRLSRNIVWDGGLFDACRVNSIVLLPHEERPWAQHSAMPYFVRRPSVRYKPMIKLNCKSSYTAEGCMRTAAQQRLCLVHWLFYEACLGYYQDLYIQAVFNGYEAMWKVKMPGFIIGKWEKFNGGQLTFRSYWLMRITLTSADGSQIVTVNELGPAWQMQ